MLNFVLKCTTTLLFRCHILFKNDSAFLRNDIMDNETDCPTSTTIVMNKLYEHKKTHVKTFLKVKLSPMERGRGVHFTSLGQFFQKYSPYQKIMNLTFLHLKYTYGFENIIHREATLFIYSKKFFDQNVYLSIFSLKIVFHDISKHETYRTIFFF